MPFPASPRLLPAELRLLLARGTREVGAQGFDVTIFDLFGIPLDPDRDIPLAPVTRLAEGAMEIHRWWMRADPVALQADRDSVVMLSNVVEDLTPEESIQLACELAPLFRDYGADLQTFSNRWYLAWDTDPGIRTWPGQEVVGRNIIKFLPRGANGAKWLGLINEAQMLLHGSEVNQQRMARGQIPANSIWLWGSGRLPTPGRTEITTIWMQDLTTKGLAALGDISSGPPCADAREWLEKATAGHHLVHLVCEDVNDELEAGLQRLNKQWLSPLLHAVKSGRLKQLTINPLHGFVYTTTSRQARRVWIRRLYLV